VDEIRCGQLAGAQPIAIGSSQYPALLAQLSDAPPILWALGNVSLLNQSLVALVGARNASSLGTRMSRSLANGIGKSGHIVVSGLARGIDTAAHLASLDTGTIAVFAGGVDVIYPSENAPLAQEIAEKGLRISEQPIGTRPMARHFPSRNRIISGLSRALVVVEAAAKSGSLITARNALDQGREVLAVPGHPFDARAAGCNMLLRDGATLVRGTSDVIETLQPTNTIPSKTPNRADETPVVAASADDTSNLHSKILSQLGPSPVAEDQLIRDLQLSAQAVGQELVTLELEGKIKRQPGGLLALAM